MVRRRRRGRYRQGGGRRQRREMAASFTAHPLVNTAWSLAVIGGDALRSRAFAALWGEICARGEAAAAEGRRWTPLDGDRIQYGSWKGKNLNQINQAIVAVRVRGRRGGFGPETRSDSLTAAESAWMAQPPPPWSPGTSATSRRSFPTWAKHEEEAVCGGLQG